jgi:hypothetical protein
MSESLGSAPFADDPVSRANAFLTKVGETRYDEWVREDLNALLAAYRAFHSNPQNETARVLADAFQTLQDLGTTFGYPLISQIGYLAARFLGERFPTTVKEHDFIHVLVEAMELVISQKMVGGGGAVGEALMRSIHSGKEKLDGMRTTSEQV